MSGMITLVRTADSTRGLNGLNTIYHIMDDDAFRLRVRGHVDGAITPSAALRAAFEAGLNKERTILEEGGAIMAGRAARHYIQHALHGGDRHVLTMRVPLGVRVKDVFQQKAVHDITFCENVQSGKIYRLNQKLNRGRFI